MGGNEVFNPRDILIRFKSCFLSRRGGGGGARAGGRSRNRRDGKAAQMPPPRVQLEDAHHDRAHVLVRVRVCTHPHTLHSHKPTYPHTLVAVERVPAAHVEARCGHQVGTSLSAMVQVGARCTSSSAMVQV